MHGLALLRVVRQGLRCATPAGGQQWARERPSTARFGNGTEVAPIAVEYSVPRGRSAVEYERHEPAGTLLHEVVRENLEPFLARARGREQPTPRFVEQEAASPSSLWRPEGIDDVY